MRDWIAYQPEGNDYIAPERWGRDHWTTLLYAESRAVDYNGVLDNRHMRCSSRLHRPFAHSASKAVAPPTRLLNGEQANHDDWSCLEDMVAAGMVEVHHAANSGGIGKARVVLTDLGWRIAHQLRRHRAEATKFEYHVAIGAERELSNEDMIDDPRT